MIYRPLTMFTGIFAMALGILFIISPQTYLSLYVPIYSADMAFAAQRLAPAIIGLGALIWAARGLTAGPVPATLCLIAGCVWAGIAATGVFHYLTGVASISILGAAVTEVVLALLFFIASRQMRNG